MTSALATAEGFASFLSQESSWLDFYRKEFGLECEPLLVCPEKRHPEVGKSFGRMIVVAQDIRMQCVFDQCQNHFNCHKHTEMELDAVVQSNDRLSASGSFAVWVRDCAEADEEHRYRSANALKQMNIFGITLLERLLYELKYFLETGKHLDVRNITLCSGSIDIEGHVPDVFWDGEKMNVGWFSPDANYGNLRTREVVL